MDIDIIISKMSLKPQIRIDIDDEQLVRRAQQNPEVFGEIFDKYYPAILAYVVRRTADISLAEDITANVFMKALCKLPQFNWRGFPVSSWLYKIATNELRMHYRKQNPNVSLEELQETVGFELPDAHDIAEELSEAQLALERQQLFMQANRLMNTLPIKYREVYECYA